VTDREGLLVRAAALTFMSEQVAKAQAAVRAELMAALKPGERAIAALGDGTEVGTVTIGRPAVYASVVDEDAFLRWVEETRPDEIVGTVRGSYRTAVLAQCKAAGAAVTRDGELVPGVRVADGSASYRPAYNKDNLSAFLDSIRANAILAIEAP
jgi:hypothetical protein